MSKSAYATVAEPEHVPAEAVIDCDYLHPTGRDAGTVCDWRARLKDGPDFRWSPPRMQPIMHDLPSHARYRAGLNPFFAPARVAAMVDRVRRPMAACLASPPGQPHDRHELPGRWRLVAVDQLSGPVVARG